MRLFFRSLLQALRTGLLNLFDLVHDEPQTGHVATKFEQRVGRERHPLGGPPWVWVRCARLPLSHFERPVASLPQTLTTAVAREPTSAADIPGLYNAEPRPKPDAPTA